MAKSFSELEAEYSGELNAIELRRKSENRGFTEAESCRVDDLLTKRDQVREERRQKVADAMAEARANPGSGDRRDPVLNPDGNRYSLLRAIDMRAKGFAVDGYEGEISQEICKRMGGTTPQGFYMPLTLPMTQGGGERRALNTTTGAGAVQTSFMGDRFIDALRNRMVLSALGATVLEDLVGVCDIPKLTGTGAAYWVAENTDPTVSSQTVGQVSLSPTTVGAYTDVTRRLIKQTSLGAENLVRNDLTTVVAIELDRAGINGSGSGAEPQGIMQNNSIPTVAIGTNGGAPTWAKLVELESTIATANADTGRMGYLTSNYGRGKLKTTEKGSAGYPIFLWDSNNTINGYQAVATSQVPSNLAKGSGTNLTSVIFGDFASVFIGMWGGIDVNVNPYSNSTNGGVRITTLLDCDIKFRRVESLAKIVDMAR